ncbi:MAG: hypothetical protein K9M57_02740 [Phycisphaerae bacterium]|nr:hypothetical protein [Phycisphaerae bacterium]
MHLNNNKYSFKYSLSHITFVLMLLVAFSGCDTKKLVPPPTTPGTHTIKYPDSHGNDATMTYTIKPDDAPPGKTLKVTVLPPWVYKNSTKTTNKYDKKKKK